MEKKKAYHITEKNNLYNIQKNGLEPRIGRRSNSVDENYKLVYFTDDYIQFLHGKRDFIILRLLMI